MSTQHPGLDEVVDLLAQESMRRGTGIIDIRSEGSIHLVFGHPLHAVAGASVGLPAVRALAERLRDQPGLEIAWIPGQTAGNQHSLEPGDAVLDLLRAAQVSSPASGQERWADVVDDVCASLEARLHRHAAPLTAAIRTSPREQGALLATIRRLRAQPLRAVSQELVHALLDDAEALVRQHLPPA